MTRFYLSDDCGFLDVGHPLWWEDESVIYCTIASGPCQRSHSLVEVPQNSRPYFTVSFETPPTWRARSLYLYPPGTGCPSYTPGHWVPFCRLLWLVLLLTTSMYSASPLLYLQPKFNTNFALLLTEVPTSSSAFRSFTYIVAISKIINKINNHPKLNSAWFPWPVALYPTLARTF
jgi:hypothetical protein